MEARLQVGVWKSLPLTVSSTNVLSPAAELAKTETEHLLGHLTQHPLLRVFAASTGGTPLSANFYTQQQDFSPEPKQATLNFKKTPLCGGVFFLIISTVHLSIF